VRHTRPWVALLKMAPKDTQQSERDRQQSSKAAPGDLANDRQTETAFQESIKFRALLEYASVGIILVDAEGRIQIVNAKVEELFGYRREELIGQPIEALVPGRFRGAHTGYCKAYRDKPSVRPMGLSPHSFARRKDGTEFPVEIGLSAVKTHEGLLVMSYLADITARVEAQESQARLQEELRRANEELEKRVEERTRELRQAQTRLLARQRLQQEVELAMEIQQNLLPHQVPDLSGYDFAATARPARYVSGDFYDFAGLSSDTCHIIVADIAGKGIPAALLSSTARTLFRAQAKHKTSPAVILNSVNRTLYEDLEHADTFITIFAARLDASYGRLSYANAGHTETIWWRDAQQGSHTLGATGMPLGIDLAFPIEESEIVLRPGDIVLFYTDGITEAANAEGELFGLERLIELVAEHSHGASEELLQAIVGAVESFQAGAALSDDVTLVVLKAHPRTISLTYPATLEHLSAIVTQIRRAAEPYGEGFACQIELAASEIVTNIITHAYRERPGELRVQLTLSSNSLQIDSYDDGDPFDLGQVAAPEPHEMQEGGYGLFVARQIVDELEYEPATPEGNHWRLVKSAA
jgi:sigma-B regulation protein RsbU (phosphoserine phosphatase)